MKRIIYVNSNHEDGKYIEESIISAKSFRRHVRDCEIVLYTNDRNFSDNVFDKVYYVDFKVPDSLKGKIHKNGQMLVKQQAMIETTRDRNLVLGSDTLALSDKVNDAFDLLDKFDMAAAHAPCRVLKPLADVPDAYPEFNCDVIFFRKNREVTDFLKKWKDIYEHNTIDHPHDQGSFRYLAYHSNLRIAVLPFEYNDRVNLFGRQASMQERKNSKSVIIQNRDVIRKILEGKLCIEDIGKCSSGAEPTAVKLPLKILRRLSLFR